MFILAISSSAFAKRFMYYFGLQCVNEIQEAIIVHMGRGKDKGDASSR